MSALGGRITLIDIAALDAVKELLEVNGHKNASRQPSLYFSKVGWCAGGECPWLMILCVGCSILILVGSTSFMS